MKNIRAKTMEWRKNQKWVLVGEAFKELANTIGRFKDLIVEQRTKITELVTELRDQIRHCERIGIRTDDLISEELKEALENEQEPR